MSLWSIFYVSVWAVFVAVAVGVLNIGAASRASNTPSDIALLSPGSTQWVGLGHPSELTGLVDATVLEDGRFAVTNILASEGNPERLCDFYDPRTKTWSNGSAVIPTRRWWPATPDLSSEAIKANVGDGTVLVLRPGSGSSSCAARLEPGSVALPPLPACGEQLAAARLNDGALLIAMSIGERRVAFRLAKGAQAFSEIPAPPLPVRMEGLRALGPRDVSMEADDKLAVLEGDTWRTLPPLLPLRYSPAIARLQDGSVAAAGGTLREDRVVVRREALAAKVVAGVALLLLLALGIRVMGSPTPPTFAAVVIGLALGWGGSVALFFAAIRGLAWH